MTIHTTHPFADPDPDPLRRLRGRLGGAVTLWTAGAGPTRAGLTVTSVMAAGGEPARMLALLDPDADLTVELEDTGLAVVGLLSWRHRDLAEVFAGLAPAPGGPWRAGPWAAAWRDTAYGPRLEPVDAWAGVRLESAVDVGWSRLVTCVLEEVHVGEDADRQGGGGDEEPLLHRRGRYLTLPGSEPPR